MLYIATISYTRYVTLRTIFVAQVLPLSLSSCAKTQFSCTDGLCIDLLNRCFSNTMSCICLCPCLCICLCTEDSLQHLMYNINCKLFRCDFKNHCPDKSDESDCKKVEIFEAKMFKFAFYRLGENFCNKSV